MPFPAGRYTRGGLCDEVVGTGCCPIFGIWQDADFRRLAKCDAGSSRTGGFFPAAAGILCAAPGLARTLAQRGLFRLRRAHTRNWGAKPHKAATRASRRGAGVLPAGRVDRVDVSHGGKIGTIGPFQANQPLSVALSERYQNAVFP